MELTQEQIEYLKDFRRRNGRRWKMYLSNMWITGKYFDENAAILQSIRNTIGPSGLYSRKMKELLSFQKEKEQNT